MNTLSAHSYTLLWYRIQRGDGRCNQNVDPDSANSMKRKIALIENDQRCSRLGEWSSIFSGSSRASEPISFSNERGQMNVMRLLAVGVVVCLVSSGVRADSKAD